MARVVYAIGGVRAHTHIQDTRSLAGLSRGPTRGMRGAGGLDPPEQECSVLSGARGGVEASVGRVLEQLEVAVGVAVHDEVGLERHVWYTGMVALNVCSCSVLPNNAGLP